jgi:hypothetical protein
MAWRVEGRKRLGGGNLLYWYWTDCDTAQTVLLGVCPFSYIGPASCLEDLQLYGKLQAGGTSICLCLTGVLL